MAEGRGGRGGGRSGRGAGRGGDGASAAGLPIFCRARYFVRGAGVYSVPLWDLTSRWMPDELKQYAREAPARGAGGADGASAPAPPPRGGGGAAAAAEAWAAADGGAPDDGQAADAEEPAAAADGGEGSASDSEQSEIAWEGLLGSESRVWSRAGVQGALVLMRQVQASAARSSRAEPEALEVAVADGPSAESYGLGVCSCLFAPEAIVDGADAPLDRRLVEVLRMREPHWAICTLRSGHFAGAVFRGPEPVCHKAIHRYTVRAKAGGSQSAADSGKTIKSAGSSLRRYGETRLAEEIKELMTEKWAAELSACELILVSVSKRMRSTLVGTSQEPFVPASKVRKLPFMVGKPTFEAVKEAYLRAASVVFADRATADALCAAFRPAPRTQEVAEAAAPAPKQAPAPEAAPEPKYSEENDVLYTALHAAAATGSEERITEELEGGADPAARDSKGRVPYFLCPTQKARDAFRRWRGENEDEWDWSAAQVPEALTDEVEQRKKDKDKEKKKKLKEKQKLAKAKAREEDEERARREEEEARALAAAQAKCESCAKPIVSKPFARLDYLYCSAECVSAHRRELQAQAAMKRFGGGS